MEKIRHAYSIVKLTCIQLFNVYIKGNGVTDKGVAFYDYCIKIIFNDYQPQSYQEMMFEKTIQERMKAHNRDRSTTAALCGQVIVLTMRPSIFWSKERPGKLVPLI